MGESEFWEAGELDTQLSSTSRIIGTLDIFISHVCIYYLCPHRTLQSPFYVPEQACYKLLLLGCVTSTSNLTFLKLNPFSSKHSHIFDSSSIQLVTTKVF
jgi:hypothetical protein